ncbi:Gfo/Idh/MocA family protein [Dolosicoccus paucivorans]
MLKVAIVGLGTIAYIHQMAIAKSEYAELVAVCDTKKETQKDYADFTFYSDVEIMLKSEDLDVVHICLPHDLHVPVAKLCLEYNVNVFLEKPISLSYDEGMELIEAEANSQATVGVCFQNRYNRTIQRLKAILNEPIQRQRYGKLLGVKGVVTWFRPESYYELEAWRGDIERAGGGTIINQSIHTLDLMHYFAGEVLGATAMLGNLLDYDINVEDSAMANFDFENDCSGLYIATNAYVKNSSVEFQIVFEHAEFTIKDFRLYETVEGYHRIQLTEDDMLDELKSYYGMGHYLCIQAFYQALINETDDYITLEEALPSMLMIDLMRLASKERREVTAKEITHE